jgi:hypothetical protein
MMMSEIQSSSLSARPSDANGERNQKHPLVLSLVPQGAPCGMKLRTIGSLW